MTRGEPASTKGAPTLSRTDLAALAPRLQASFAGRCLRGFVALEGVDRALVIAAQAFTALIPLLILASALAPKGQRDAVANTVIRRFGLEGDAASAVQTLFTRPETATGELSLLSLLLVLVSGVSFTRRVQRMYQQAWGLPRLGVRGPVNAALGLGALLLEILLLYLLRSLARGLPLDRLLTLPISIVAGVVLWTSIPWLLLDRRVDWRRLVPAGVLAAAGISLYGVATSIYMPGLIERYSERFGVFGVTVALVGWLLCVALVLVATTVIGAEFDRTQAPWARRLKARFRLPSQ